MEVARSSASAQTGGDVDVYVLVYWKLLTNGYLDGGNSASTCIALYIVLLPVLPDTDNTTFYY